MNDIDLSVRRDVCYTYFSCQIPLYGCGGTSQLVLVDVRQLSEGYIINIGEVTLKRTTPFLGWGELFSICR